MFKYVRICFRKHCDFSGRARMCEYWYLLLFDHIFLFVFAFIPELFILHYTRNEKIAEGVAYLISFLYFLLTLLPHLACKVRRLHDLDKSAWYLLYWFIPIFSPLRLANWILCYEGLPGNNKYGPNPKEVEDN